MGPKSTLTVNGGCINQLTQIRNGPGWARKLLLARTTHRLRLFSDSAHQFRPAGISLGHNVYFVRNSISRLCAKGRDILTRKKPLLQYSSVLISLALRVHIYYRPFHFVSSWSDYSVLFFCKDLYLDFSLHEINLYHKKQKIMVQFGYCFFEMTIKLE